MSEIVWVAKESGLNPWTMDMDQFNGVIRSLSRMNYERNKSHMSMREQMDAEKRMEREDAEDAQ